MGEIIHVNLDKFFIIGPPLKLGTVEKYLQKTLVLQGKNRGDFGR